ncbi:MAG: glycine zipper 2TM domain-containing protein [Phenylobacterium sp.]
MRKHHLAAGIAALTLIPGLAMAQVTCEQRSQNRAAGTAVGAVAGALLGSAVAGHHDRGTGAVVGGVGGAIVGNQLARGPRDCAHAYGWYDNDGRWHGQRVSESSAYGYYDRSGTWIDGRPAGRWSNGVYIADAGAYGTNTAYVTREHTNDIQTRLERMDNWIDRARENGRLSYREARNAQMQLNDIRREARYRTRDGYLSGREEARLQTRLDRLAQQIRFDANS